MFDWKKDLISKLPKGKGSIKKYGRSNEEKFNTIMKSVGTDKSTNSAMENASKFSSVQLRTRKNPSSQKIGYGAEDWDKYFKQQDEARKEKEKQQTKPKFEDLKPRKINTETQTQPKTEHTPSLLDDIGSTFKTAYHALNPFDKVSFDKAIKDYLNHKASKSFNEVARGSNRAVDSASLGLISNLDKKLNNREPYYTSERKMGEGGGTDLITSGLGYLVPGVGEYKLLNSSKAGKALTKIGEKGLAKKLASEGVKGAVIGTGLSVPEVAIKEGLNSKDQNWKDNLKYIGENTLLGAVADPVLYGAGKAIGKGFEKATEKTMKGLMPSNKHVADSVSSVISKEDKSNLRLKRPIKTDQKVETPILQEIIHQNKPIPLMEPKVEVPKIESPKVDTSHIDKKMESIKHQIESMKVKSPTKTEIDDQLRSLDINDAYLQTSKRDKKISDEEFWRKHNENNTKRQLLAEQNKAYTHEVHANLKHTWNNKTRAYELGDYGTKQAYGGGFNLYKGGQVIGKHRTKDEAIQAMQKAVADEKGIPFNPEKDEVLNFKSTYNEWDKNWDIKARDYSIIKGDKGWAVKKGDQSLGVFKTEKKAREVAQRHYDSQPRDIKPSGDTTTLEQRLSELNQQREALLKPAKQKQIQENSVSQDLNNMPIEERYKFQEDRPKILENINSPEKPTSTIEPSANEPKPIERRDNIPYVQGERKHYSTLANSEKAPSEFIDGIKNLDRSYNKISDQEVVDFANGLIGRDIEEAFQFIKNAERFDKRHTAVGARLIDEFNKRGEFDRTVDMADILAKEGTKFGQGLQSFSIYNRLSPEGQLIRAQRRVSKINENISNPEKRVKLTEQNIQDITQAADSIRKFTGQEEQTNNVIKIMDSIKNGNTPTDTELETVRSFVSDAKKFIRDLTPKTERKAPKQIKDTRIRDKVVNHMNEAEEAARLRLRQKFNRANSLPVDVFYDLSVIGASKVAKGTVKLADFTEEIAKEFGDFVRPYINQIYDKAVETFNLQSESMSPKRLSEVEKITNKALKDKNLSEDEAETIREFARKVGQMTGDAKLESSMELQSILQALERPTFGQKISSAQTIAQLLNPKTMVRNALGNEIFYRVEQLNKLLATPIDIAKSKLFGTERTITFISNNQGEYWKNFLMGGKAGWRGQNPMGLTTSYDLQAPAFNSKFNPLTYLEKSLGATLRSFDTAGYKRAYNKTIGELATLRAINEGLKGEERKSAIQQYIREADENIKNIADQYGKYATFQDHTALSHVLTKTKKGMNYLSTKGLTLGLAPTKDFGLGDLILKYPKTPANLIMRALEYSPVGFIRSSHIIKEALKTKNPFISREATLAFTRGITGTAGFSLLGYVLADKGILTSSGNSDYEVASLERNAGKQPNSVNISALHRFIASGFNLKKTQPKKGDTFVSYDWAQPVSMAIALGTGVNQSVQEKGKLKPIDAGLGAFDSATNTIIQQSVLKGLNDFLANFPGRTMSDRFADAGKGIVGSFVPTAVNQVRQLNDNTTRTTYNPSFIKEMLNRANNRIPVSEKSLSPSYDTLGNRREVYQNGSNNAFNVLLNPSFVSKYKPSPEAKFVLDFINQTGDKTVAPRMVQKKLDGKQLTGKQYSEMQKIMGTETRIGLQRELPNIQGEKDFEKIKKVLDKILRDAGKKARTDIRKEMK